MSVLHILSVGLARAALMLRSCALADFVDGRLGARVAYVRFWFLHCELYEGCLKGGRFFGCRAGS